MKFNLDEYAHLNSPIHRWQPESKLIGLGSLMIAFAGVEKLFLLPVVLLITVIIYRLSHLPHSFWQSRLRYPGFFLMGVVFLLPFVSGKTVIGQWAIGQWTFLTLRQEGCLAMLLIASRFVAIMTICLVLFGTCSFLTTIKAMRSLGLSPILADMTLLSYRYIFELGQQVQTLTIALRLRGFKPRNLTQRNLRIFASVMGTLLVRSYEQSEQVYNAMRLRGYGKINQKINQKSTHPSLGIKQKIFPDKFSAIALSISVIIAISLIGTEILL